MATDSCIAGPSGGSSDNTFRYSKLRVAVRDCHSRSSSWTGREEAAGAGCHCSTPRIGDAYRYRSTDTPLGWCISWVGLVFSWVFCFDMDIVLLISVASGLIVLLCVLAIFKQRSSKEKPAIRVPAPGRGNDGVRPRRAVGARHARARTRYTAQHYNESDDADDDDDENEPKGIEFSEKLGAKKRAKLEAKAEKKAHREAEMREREEKKKRKELEEEERLKTEEISKLEREKELEEERKALEEKERKEQEEYMKMKEMFSVEEEGFDEGGNSDSEENLLQEFVSYIKKMKVVVLEDLAATFKLKTQNVIDRIQDLQKDGILTGVIDDRGKFIYISQEELTAVSKFVKQRGRVSIAELAESSNQLINLNPVQSVEVKS